MEKRKSRFFIGAVQLVFVVSVIAFALFLSAILKPETNKERRKPAMRAQYAPISVSVTRPTPRSITPGLTLNGVVTAQTRSTITPQVGGQVMWVSEKFRPGGVLKKGDPIFKIDPRDYQLAVQQAKASIAAADADLKVLETEAELAIKEWDELFPTEPISDLAARKPQIAAAQARLDGARAAAKTSELALSRTRINAYETVKVLATTLSVGQVIPPNQSVGEVFTVANIEISASLSQDELQSLSPAIGRKVSFSPSQNASQNSSDNKSGETGSGEIVRVAAELDARTRLTRLFIRPDNPLGLFVGNFVEVKINRPEISDAIVLPQSALASRDSVWVVRGGKLSLHKVRILEEWDGEIAVENFNYEDGILSLPLPNISEGQAVVIRDPADTMGGNP